MRVSGFKGRERGGMRAGGGNKDEKEKHGGGYAFADCVQ